MKLLTFLGVGKYEETVYLWNQREHTTRYSPAASCVFLHPDELIIFLTEEAQEAHFAELKSGIDPSIRIQPIPVPHGSNTQELWQIFDQVTGVVAPGEEVAFDITNGLRSFPLVGLLVAAFLQNGLDVNLNAVLYGAFDVRDKTVEPNRTTMFDLSPMLDLIKWSAAADRFNRTGDARFLASLLSEQRNIPGKQAGKNRDLRELAGSMGNLASALTSISQSLRLIRPYQTMDEVAGLPSILEKADPALMKSNATRPFSLLLERVNQTFLPLGMDDPWDETNLATALEKQRTIIRWYVKREQWVQAITLSREWIVSWFMNALGSEDLLNFKEREDVTKRINEAYIVIRASKKSDVASEYFPNVPEAVSAMKIWCKLVSVRNDIDHAGMNENPGSPEDQIKVIKEVINLIEELPIKDNA